MSRKAYLTNPATNLLIERRISAYNQTNILRVDEKENYTLTDRENQTLENYQQNTQFGLESNRTIPKDLIKKHQRRTNTHETGMRRKIKINSGIASGNDSIVFSNNDWSILLDSGRNSIENTHFFPKTSELISKPLTTSKNTRKYGMIATRLNQSSRRTERVIDYTKHKNLEMHKKRISADLSQYMREN